MVTSSFAINRDSFKALLLPLSKIVGHTYSPVNLELSNNHLSLTSILCSKSLLYRCQVELPHYNPPTDDSFRATFHLVTVQKLFTLISRDSSLDVLVTYGDTLRKLRVTTPYDACVTGLPELDLTLSTINTSEEELLSSKNYNCFKSTPSGRIPIHLDSLISYLSRVNTINNLLEFKLISNPPTLKIRSNGSNIQSEASLPLDSIIGDTIQAFYISTYDYDLLRPLIEGCLEINSHRGYLQFGNNTPLKLEFINSELGLSGDFILAPRIKETKD